MITKGKYVRVYWGPKADADSRVRFGTVVNGTELYNATVGLNTEENTLYLKWEDEDGFVALSLLTEDIALNEGAYLQEVLDVGLGEKEIDEELREKIEKEVREYTSLDEDYGSAFDVAVDVAHGMNPPLVHEDEGWAIPQYVVEIAERILGKDDES